MLTVGKRGIKTLTCCRGTHS